MENTKRGCCVLKSKMQKLLIAQKHTSAFHDSEFNPTLSGIRVGKITGSSQTYWFETLYPEWRLMGGVYTYNVSVFRSLFTLLLSDS